MSRNSLPAPALVCERCLNDCVPRDLSNLEDNWPGGWQVRDRAKETEARSSSLGRVAALNESDAVYLMVDDLADRSTEGEHLAGVKIAYEDAVLHSPSKALHRLVDAPESRWFPYVVANKVAAPLRHQLTGL